MSHHHTYYVTYRMTSSLYTLSFTYTTHRLLDAMYYMEMAMYYMEMAVYYMEMAMYYMEMAFQKASNKKRGKTAKENRKRTKRTEHKKENKKKKKRKIMHTMSHQ